MNRSLRANATVQCLVVVIAFLAITLPTSRMLANGVRVQDSDGLPIGERGPQSPDEPTKGGASDDRVAFRNGVVFENEPQLWVHGIPAAPELAAKIGAGGVRGIVDLRGFSSRRSARMLKTYADLDLGLCITLRWEAPKVRGERRTGKDRVDAPPTADEADESIRQMIEFLNLPDAKRLDGKLWVQFYNEISGGPGRFGEDEEEAMFDYAEKLAQRIRLEAPHVRICGPALTGIDVLENDDDSNLAGISKLRYNRLIRTLQWSAKNADAVDLHLHAEDGPWAAQQLDLVRQRLDEQEGGRDTAIVSFEWSCARFRDREDKEAVRNVLQEIWKVLKEHHVVVAAYGAYWPGQNQKDTFQWKSLVNSDGTPNEPFYSFFTDAAGHQRESRAESDHQ